MPTQSHQNLGDTQYDIFSVRMTGAMGDGTTDDTQAFADAIAAQVALGGGRIKVPDGTFVVSQISLPVTATPIELVGNGIGCTMIIQKSGSNKDLITCDTFSDLTGSNQQAGIFHCAIKNMTIDGNKGSQSSGSGLKLYGHAFYLHDLLVQNCVNDGIYTEFAIDSNFSDPTKDLEPHFFNVKSRQNGGNGWSFCGPHDAVMESVTLLNNGRWGLETLSAYGSCTVSGTTCTYAANSGHSFKPNMTQITLTISGVPTTIACTYVSRTVVTLASSVSSGTYTFASFSAGSIHIGKLNTFLNVLGGVHLYDGVIGEDIQATTGTGQGMLIDAECGAVAVMNGIWAAAGDNALVVRNTNNRFDGVIVNSNVGILIDGGGFNLITVNFFSVNFLLSYNAPQGYDVVRATGIVPHLGAINATSVPVTGLYEITAFAVDGSTPTYLVQFPSTVIEGTLTVGSAGSGRVLFLSTGSTNYLQSCTYDESAGEALVLAGPSSVPIPTITAIARQVVFFNSDTAGTVGTRTTQVVIKSGADQVGDALEPFKIIDNTGALLMSVDPSGIGTFNVLHSHYLASFDNMGPYIDLASDQTCLITGRGSTSNVTFAVDAVSGVAAHIQEWRVAGTVVAYVDAAGNFSNADVVTGGGSPNLNSGLDSEPVGKIYGQTDAPSSDSAIWIKGAGGSNGWTQRNTFSTISGKDSGSGTELAIAGKLLPGDMDVGGTVTMTLLTASLPLKVNASKAIIAAAIDLSTAETTGALNANRIGGGGLTNAQVAALAGLTVSQLSAIAAITSTQLGYLSGFTSDPQTQIDAKVSQSDYDAHTHPYLTGGGSVTISGTDSHGDTFSGSGTCSTGSGNTGTP